MTFGVWKQFEYCIASLLLTSSWPKVDELFKICFSLISLLLQLFAINAFRCLSWLAWTFFPVQKSLRLKLVKLLEDDYKRNAKVSSNLSELNDRKKSSLIAILFLSCEIAKARARKPYTSTSKWKTKQVKTLRAKFWELFVCTKSKSMQWSELLMNYEIFTRGYWLPEIAPSKVNS